LHITNCIIFEKQLCVLFTPIDSFHHSVHKSIKVQLPKNEKFTVYQNM